MVPTNRTEQSEPVVRVDDLRKEYETSNGSITALEDVSLSIESGTVVGILGPNGAGKTTLIKSILDLVHPTSGSVEVFGDDVHDSGRELYSNVSAMLEGARNVYWRLSLRENLYYFTGLQGIDPSAVRSENLEIIESLDLTDKLDEPVNTLSRGMKQKAVLACTLVRRTDLMFLDEPTLGLDVEAARDLRKTLRRLADDSNRTVVLSSHDMDVIEELCDRVIVLNEGEIIVNDTVSSLLEAFKTQSYRYTLGDSLPATARARLEESCSSISWDGNTEFEATLAGPMDYYDLTSILEEKRAIVESIETVDPDLEEVFLRVTDEQESESTGKIVEGSA